MLISIISVCQLLAAITGVLVFFLYGLGDETMTDDQNQINRADVFSFIGLVAILVVSIAQVVILFLPIKIYNKSSFIKISSAILCLFQLIFFFVLVAAFFLQTFTITYFQSYWTLSRRAVFVNSVILPLPFTLISLFMLVLYTLKIFSSAGKIKLENVEDGIEVSASDLEDQNSINSHEKEKNRKILEEMTDEKVIDKLFNGASVQSKVASK